MGSDRLGSPAVKWGSLDSGCIIKWSVSPTLSTWPARRHTNMFNLSYHTKYIYIFTICEVVCVSHGV